jgi:hypothetical protein
MLIREKARHKQELIEKLSILINQTGVDNDLGVRDFTLAQVMVNAGYSFSHHHNEELRLKGYPSTAAAPDS